MNRARTLAGTPLFAALIVAAMMLRALVPAGWMPVPTPHGIALTLCTGAGPVTVGPMTAGHDRDTAPAPRGHDMPCGFAAHAATPPGQALVIHGPALVWLALPPGEPAPYRHIGAGLGAPPRPATGPPAIA